MGNEELLLLLDDDNKEPFTKDTFVAALKNLHIGEWRRQYSNKRFGTRFVMVRSLSLNLNTKMAINP